MITGRKQSQSEGKDIRERIQNWFNHFQQLLGEEPVIDDENEIIQTVFDDLDFKTGEFTIDEYKKAKDRISLNKASGPDDTPPEVIKKCNLDDILLNFANRLLLNHDIPAQWSTSNIIPVPKKGALSKAENNRGISLKRYFCKTCQPNDTKLYPARTGQESPIESKWLPPRPLNPVTNPYPKKAD